MADPGDLRTQMHQEAFPGEDISDRPLPEVAVPGLLALAEGSWPSGRYRLQELGSWPASGLEPDTVGAADGNGIDGATGGQLQPAGHPVA